MRDALYHLEHSEATTLQARIREVILTTVGGGQLSSGDSIPSTRSMARRLGVSRNTVTLAYHALVADGFLAARERSGFFVAEQALAGSVAKQIDRGPAASDIDWESRFSVRPALQDNIDKPADWRDYQYPFVYGQADADLFPISEWRDCVRQAMGRRWLDTWTEDRFALDDPMLVEQICKRILPRRGIQANEDEILVTLGAQNGLFLISSLLGVAGAKIGIENPGYPDVRNHLSLCGVNVTSLDVDQDGLRVDERLDGLSIVFATPSHQFPTTVTMSIDRRRSLLAAADENDFVIVEDDYEFETNYLSEPCPALKSLDRSGRVLYVGSLSKSLVPGLRVGFIVGPKPFIREARAMRRLMYRHPPSNNQRAVALFLAEGYHDSLIHRLHRVYKERWTMMGESLQAYFPDWFSSPSFGGTSYWIEGPKALNSFQLTEVCAQQSLLIEPGVIYFAGEDRRKNYFRLGFSAIQTERIEPGIKLLRQIVDNIRPVL